MSKRKFGFEGFGINRQTTYNFERNQAPQRLYVPPSSRSGGAHDNYEDTDLDNIEYDEHDAVGGNNNVGGEGGGEDDEIDPLDAFMEGIHEEMKAAPPPKPKEKLDKYKDDIDDDPMESFLKAKKDVGLQLAADALHAGYNSDEEVYAAAKAVDAGLVEYDSDDNPIVVDRKKIEPIPALDHSEIDYEPFNKDFYEEKPSISGVTYACPSTKKEIKYEFYLVTMSSIYYVWINGSRRYTVYVHFAEEMFEMVSWTLQSLTQQHFSLYLVYSGEKGRGRGKRNAMLKPGSIYSIRQLLKGY